MFRVLRVPQEMDRSYRTVSTEDKITVAFAKPASFLPD